MEKSSMVAIGNMINNMMGILHHMEPFFVLLVLALILYLFFSDEGLTLKQLQSTDARLREYLKTNLVNTMNITINEINKSNDKLVESVVHDKSNPKASQVNNQQSLTTNKIEEKQRDLLKNQYNQYKRKLIYLADNDNNNSLQRFQNSQEKYFHWKDHLFRLVKSVDNELTFELIDFLGNSDVIKDLRLLSFPLDNADQDKNIKRLKKLSNDLQSIEKLGDLTDLLAFDLINVRAGQEVDYRINDEKMSIDERVFIKNQLNAILITMKQLDKKLPQSINDVFAKAYEIEQLFLTPLKKIQTDKLLDVWFDPNVRDKKSQTKQILDQADDIIRTNFSLTTKLSEKVDSFENDYQTFLRKRLIKPLSELQSVHLNFNRSKISGASIQKWKKILDEMIKIYLHYLEKVLTIKILNIKRGDIFDPTLHLPNSTGEPDNKLADNQIKSIVSYGFIYENSDRKVLIKPADVIVVKN